MLNDQQAQLRFHPRSGTVLLAAQDDCKRSAKYVSKFNNSQFWKRSFTRNLFVWIEAWLHLVKVDAFNHHQQNARVLYLLSHLIDRKVPKQLLTEVIPLTELHLLLDQRVDIKDNGHCKVSDSYPTFERNFRFAMRMLTRVYGLSFEPEYSAPGWTSLIIASTIRNRITHPKERMDITSGELDTIIQGHKWFQTLFASYHDSENRRRAEFEESLKQWFFSLPDNKKVAIWQLQQKGLLFNILSM